MSRKASARTQATIRKHGKSGQRVEDRSSLRDLGYHIAAGGRVDDEDIRPGDDLGPMFPQDDVDTGLDQPANGVWSFGPLKA